MRSRPLQVVLLLAAALASTPLASDSFTVPSDYEYERAVIPALCRAPQQAHPPLQAACGARSSSFRACFVVHSLDVSCDTLCYSTLLTRALETSTCRSPWNLTVLVDRCVSQCRGAQTVMADALRSTKTEVKALVYVAYVGGTYRAQYVAYRPTIKELKRYLPAMCIPNSKCVRSKCKRNLCRRAIGSGKAPQSQKNCWFCYWTRSSCPLDCRKFQWKFRWVH